jgi:CBS domain-containing protein
MPQAIHDIMTRDVKIVNPESTIRDAAQLMNSEDFGSLPVCVGRKVVGVITDRDITIRAVAQGCDPGSTRVSEVMTKEVVSVRDNSDLTEAERLMRDRQLRRLPVVSEQGELVGYLAMAKVARTESPEQTGDLIKGISQRSKPAPRKS